MTTAVIDASVAIQWLALGRAHEDVFVFDELIAPNHLDAEIANGLRRLWLTGALGDADFVERALRIPRLPVVRKDWSAHIPRALELAPNITMYDAAYIAIAEDLGAPLLTLDARLTRAPGARCAFRLLVS